MRIACRCEKCGYIHIQEDDDVCLEIDFKEKKMTFICRAKGCRHESVLDFGDWKDDQGKSPLPRIGIV
jgi:hypothetical protein